MSTISPTGDARSDARSSLPLRYRYRFANSSCSWGKPPRPLRGSAVVHGGNPQDHTASPRCFTAIPKLLKVLELAGCIVTIDAIGCQKEIVKLITQQNADYVITLKKNQGNLYDEVEKLFRSGVSTSFEELQHSTYKTEETGHGRHEIRHYVMLSQIQSQLDPDSVWSNFNSVGMVLEFRLKAI